MKPFLITLALLLALFQGRPARAITADSYVRDGNTKYQEKHYDEAVKAYQIAVKMERTNAAAFQGLGNCYLAKGERERAIVYYQYSLQMNPANKDLAAYVEKLSSPGQATALTSTAGEASKYAQYGRYYAGTKKWDYALYYFDKSLQADPENASVLEAAGRAHLEKGDKDKALENFDKALAIDVSNEELKKLADQLRDHSYQAASPAPVSGTATAATPSKAPSGKFWGGAALAVAAVLAIALF